MDRCRINPFDLLNEYYSDLQEKLSATADAHEKHILRMRLGNLHGVREFLASARMTTRSAQHTRR